MITHYDMASGQLLAETDAADLIDTRDQYAMHVEARLQTVAETVQSDASRANGLPADLLGVDAADFILRQDRG